MGNRQGVVRLAPVGSGRQHLGVDEEKRLAGRPILDGAVSDLASALGGTDADARLLFLGLLGEDDFKAEDSVRQLGSVRALGDGGKKRGEGRA